MSAMTKVSAYPEPQQVAAKTKSSRRQNSSPSPVFSRHRQTIYPIQIHVSCVYRIISADMKLPVLISLLGLLVATASAVVSQKAVIVSYPNETPDFVVNQAMDAIREAVSFSIRKDTASASC
jgi:hypothetical protein